MRFLFLLAALAWPAFADDALTISEKLAANGGGSGNADIYSGGEPRMRRIELARQKLSATLSYIVDKNGDVCSTTRCEPGRSAALCKTVEAATASQKKSCDVFVQRNANAIGEKIQKFGPTSIAISASPLKLTGGRQVAAMTSPEGRIVLHGSMIDQLADDELLTLLFHEYGHKITIPDDKAVYGFARGETLLDVAGACVAWLANQAALPNQEPPEMSSENWKNFCKSKDPERSGMLADVATLFLNIGEFPRPTFAREVVKHEASRSRWLKSSFKRYLRREILPEEETFFLERFSKGEGVDSVLASLVGNAEYGRAETSAAFVSRFFADFVGRDPSADEIRAGTADLLRHDRATWALAAFRKSRETQERLVRDWYRDYLNRSPSSSEIAGEVTRLTSGEAWEDIQARLLAGDEYAGLQRKRVAHCSKP